MRHQRGRRDHRRWLQPDRTADHHHRVRLVGQGSQGHRHRERHHPHHDDVRRRRPSHQGRRHRRHRTSRPGSHHRVRPGHRPGHQDGLADRRDDHQGVRQARPPDLLHRRRRRRNHHRVRPARPPCQGHRHLTLHRHLHLRPHRRAARPGHQPRRLVRPDLPLTTTSDGSQPSRTSPRPYAPAGRTPSTHAPTASRSPRRQPHPASTAPPPPTTPRTADRLVGTGYTYDAFGRTTALPASTIGYYANDLAYQQTSGCKRQTWQLDANLRFRSWKVETGSSTTWTQTQSKLNHYDSDGDNPRWITEDTATCALTRNVDSASGDLAATTSKTGDTVLQLTTIHGDVALQLPLDSGVPLYAVAPR